jgi:trk system potassium uptake protein TrkH
MSDIRTVLRDLGGIFIIIGFVTLIALIVPIAAGETGADGAIDAAGPILITATIYFGFGFPLYYLLRKADPANFKSAMVTAALGWFFISLVAAIPFWLIPYDGINRMDFLSAFFESMSGWTGTGLTMVGGGEANLPMALQFWRSLIQWVGGVGVIVLTLSILARPGTGSFVLYKGEARDQKTHPSIISTVRTIWWIFLLYTIIGILVLFIIGVFDPVTGMNPWESLNHAMTGLATGGFSVTSDSLASFGTISQIAIVFLMIFGAIAFAAHYDLLKGHIKKFLSDAQFKAMVALIILGVIALTYINLELYDHNWLLSLKNSGFQFVSSITCTGFASVNNIQTDWSASAKLILSSAMIIGGAAGSTAGGIKLFRAILLYNGVSWRIKRAISTPRRVFVHKLGNKPLSKDDAMDLINEAAIISFIWVILLFVGFIIVKEITGQEIENVIFEVCSAQGNVGLTAGITSIDLPSPAKIMLIINMWIGRLEIIPIIVLIKSMFGIRKNLV